MAGSQTVLTKLIGKLVGARQVARYPGHVGVGESEESRSTRHAVDSIAYSRGCSLAQNWSGIPANGDETAGTTLELGQNPLWDYFSQYREGPGIWKWNHYFQIYNRHLAKFRGQQPTIAEVGVYSGGSLPMWQHYFGEGSQIHGIDIEPDCKGYESENVTIHIGDQENRAFWAEFRETVGKVDVLIDDGGHTPEQQMVTLEEMLPTMPPGSVYLCEDIHRESNRFADFAAGLVAQLNVQDRELQPVLRAKPTAFQQSISSMHFYPYVCVIEKHALAPVEFLSPKHGTQWQPFYERDGKQDKVSDKSQ